MSDFRWELLWLREMQLDRGYRRAWVYYKLRAEFELGLQELELIAETLGYRRSWAWHQWRNLQEEREFHNRARSQYNSASNQSQTQRREFIPSRLEKPLSLLSLEFPFTKQQLAAAYRRLAVLSHPDTGGTDEKFIAVNQAYEALKAHITVLEGVS